MGSLLTDRERKLPKWAQESIEHDRRLMLELRALLEASEAEQPRSPFFTRTYVDGEFRTTYMPAKYRMEFETETIKGEIVARGVLGEGDRVRLYFDSKAYDERIYLEPGASNTIDLVSRKRYGT